MLHFKFWSVIDSIKYLALVRPVVKTIIKLIKYEIVYESR